MEKKRGRPPKAPDKVKGERIEFRASLPERQAYEEAAKTAKLETSEWIRDRLARAAKRELGK